MPEMIAFPIDGMLMMSRMHRGRGARQRVSRESTNGITLIRKGTRSILARKRTARQTSPIVTDVLARRPAIPREETSTMVGRILIHAEPAQLIGFVERRIKMNPIIAGDLETATATETETGTETEREIVTVIVTETVTENVTETGGQGPSRDLDMRNRGSQNPRVDPRTPPA